MSFRKSIPTMTRRHNSRKFVEFTPFRATLRHFRCYCQVYLVQQVTASVSDESRWRCSPERSACSESVRHAGIVCHSLRSAATKNLQSLPRRGRDTERGSSASNSPRLNTHLKEKGLADQYPFGLEYPQTNPTTFKAVPRGWQGVNDTALPAW